MLLHILQFSLFKASKQGWSSTSCTEFRWWHPLGHGPAMGSKMAADCLCRMRKLSIFSSYVLIITVFIAVFGRQHPPFWCQCSLRQWPNGVSTCAISKIHCNWCSTSLGQQETAVPTMLRAKLCPPPPKKQVLPIDYTASTTPNVHDVSVVLRFDLLFMRTELPPPLGKQHSTAVDSNRMEWLRDASLNELPQNSEYSQCADTASTALKIRDLLRLHTEIYW